MNRTIIVLTGLVIIIMTALSITRIDTPVQLFMGATIFDFTGRLAVLVGLVALALTHRPRTSVQRTALGMLGLIVLTIAFSEVFSYRLALFDGLVYFIGATSLFIEAIEPASAPSGKKALAA